jgi:outer membrane lipoprotein-sorting protein
MLAQLDTDLADAPQDAPRQEAANSRDEAKTTFDAFFDAFESKRETVHAFRAQFIHTTITPGDDFYEMPGSVAFNHPRELLLEYEEPPQTYYVDETIYCDYFTEASQLTVRRIEDSREIEPFFLAFERDPAALKKDYHVSISAQGVDGCDGPVVILVPKPVAGREPLFQQAQLFLRETDYLPCRLFVETTGDSHFNIVFTDYDINPTVDDQGLRFRLPEGVSIIIDDELVEVTGEQGASVPDDLPLDKLTVISLGESGADTETDAP